MSEELEQQTADLEQQVIVARVRDQRQKWWLFGLAMLLAISVAIIAVLLHNAEGRAESSGAQVVVEQAEKKDLAKEAQQALCGTKDTEIFDKDLCEKLASAAQEPVEPPAEPPVVIGPSRADLVQAFRVYCSEGDNCKGADGAAPTADDIAAAFVRFCADGRCTGPAGQNGEDGESPAPLAPQYEMVLAAVTEICGTGVCNGPTGERGPGPTDEMVLAAVTTVCAKDACRGPAGPSGADSTVPGPAGEPGRGIADTYCADSGLWQITYTDGEVDTDGGACREPKPSIPPIEVTP